MTFCSPPPHLKASDFAEPFNTTRSTSQPAIFGGQKPDLEKAAVLMMTFDGSSPISTWHHC